MKNQRGRSDEDDEQDKRAPLLPEGALTQFAEQRENGVRSEQGDIGFKAHDHQVDGVEARIHNDAGEDAGNLESGLQNSGDETGEHAGGHRRGKREDRMSGKRDHDADRAPERVAAVGGKIADIKDCEA